MFIPTTDPSLINSLSSLINPSGSSRYNQIQGVVSRRPGYADELFLVSREFSRPFTLRVVTVPEPTATYETQPTVIMDI